MLHKLLTSALLRSIVLAIINPLLAFSFQGGAIAILTACERPNDFSGMVLISPLVVASPDVATPIKVKKKGVHLIPGILSKCQLKILLS